MNTSTNNLKAIPHPRRGFTIIELLAVIVILGILTALTVSVGMYLKQDSARKATVATLDILSAAIAAYAEETGAVPAGDPGAATNTTSDIAYAAEAHKRSASLRAQLEGVRSSRERIANLPQEATPRFGQYANAFVDGFEMVIDYLPSGGMGGATLLISAGPDGKFGISPADESLSKDNIQK